jgi:hypothetical protein
MQSIARKETNRTEENGREIIFNDIIRFDFDAGVQSAIEDIFDDWEYAQNHGVQVSEDGELFLLDVTQLLDEMEDRIMNDGTPDNEDSHREKMIFDYLSKYKGFTIWV